MLFREDQALLVRRDAAHALHVLLLRLGSHAHLGLPHAHTQNTHIKKTKIAKDRKISQKHRTHSRTPIEFEINEVL